MNRLKILFFLLCPLISTCGSSDFEAQPYTPDTTELPTLTLKFDIDLNATTVKSLGVFGAMENGGGFEEIATETEFHLDQQDLAIYALAGGIVMYIQPPLSGAQAGEVEGVWVRYGRNFLIKYVHVKNPVVQEGQVIAAGDKIGTTITDGQNRGFWEVEVDVKEGDTIYARPFYDYCDADCKSIMDTLWDDETITRSDNAIAPWKVLDQYDQTALTSIFF